MAREELLVTKGLGDQLHDIILSRILAGTLHPGERLIPAALRADFGVSITPVRDALNRLKQAGFVQVRPREGVTVSLLNVKRARDVQDMRIALETLAARNAATCAPRGEVVALDRRFGEAAARLSRGGDEKILDSIDWEIHELVVRYADNELLQQALRTIHHHVQWVGGIAGVGARRVRRSFEEHQQIMRALLRRDPEAAGEAMRRHLTNTKDTMLRYLESVTGGSGEKALIQRSSRRKGTAARKGASLA